MISRALADPRNQTAKGRELKKQLYEDQRSSAQRGWREKFSGI